MSTRTTSVPPPEAPLPGRYEPPPHGSLQPKSRKRGLIWAVLLLLIAGVAGYAVWRASQPNTALKGKGGGGAGGRGQIGPVPVVVTKVARSSIPVYLNGLGNVTPYFTVTVKSRVDGQLMTIHYKEGDLVTKDQLLAEIDPRPFEVQKHLAEATLAHDQALLANARVDQDRYEQLVKTDAIPSQQLDTQKALVQQLVATTKQDQANIDNASLQLTYAKVTAPITGVLGLRLVDPGNIVHASDQNGIIIITQLQPITVVFTIPEDSLPQVGQKVRAGIRLPVDAYNRDNSKKLASGWLLTMDNQIDPTTGTSRGKAVFDNKDNSLFPQQFVNINLLVDTLTNQLVVPNVAVQNGQNGATFVYVVDDDSRVHIRPVQVGITTAAAADILNGISDGDRVVVDGTDRLIENAVVRVRKPGELENPAGYDPSAAGKGGRRGNRAGKGDGGGGGDQGGGDRGGHKKGDRKGKSQ